MKKIIVMTALAMGLCLSSCTKEEVYSDKPFTNMELKTILQEKGVTFNEAGCILLDDAARAITSLDLSGKKIADFAGLEALPNLTELILANNEYGPVFDFATVPAQITSIDLSGNKFFSVKNLVDIKEEANGDEKVTLLHDFSKFVLPESAKSDCNELVAYYTTDTEVEMKLGTQAYNTLREVPDPAIREALKNSFASIFTEDGKIDLQKRFVDPTEAQAAIFLAADSWGSPMEGVTSLEGVQYVIMNKGYKGSMFVASFAADIEMPSFILNDNMAQMVTINLSTPYMDLSKAKNLCTMQVTNNKGLTNLDFSNCVLLGQRGIDMELDMMNNPSSLRFVNCNGLKSLVFPAKAKHLEALELSNAKSLEKLDLSQFEHIGSLIIAGDINCDVTYLDYNWAKYKKAKFGTSENVFAKPETKAFCKKFYKKDTNEGLRVVFPSSDANIPNFIWSDHI